MSTCFSRGEVFLGAPRCFSARRGRNGLSGGAWAIVAIGFISVAREGIETTLLLWSMVQSFGSKPDVLLGALLGLAAAVVLGWLLARGMVRIDLRVFFAWTGAFLVVVAAGVLAYAIHDLQEAGALPAPFTAAAPVDPVTGAVAVGWSAFPFGWAFDVTGAIPPGSPLAAVLQATVGFMPQMSWLQVVAWVLYLAVVGTVFVRGLRRRPAQAAGSGAAPTPASAVDAEASLAPSPAAFSPAHPADVGAPDASTPDPQGAR